MIVGESWLRLLRTERVTECEDISRGRSAHATRTSGATGPRVFRDPAGACARLVGKALDDCEGSRRTQRYSSVPRFVYSIYSRQFAYSDRLVRGAISLNRAPRPFLQKGNVSYTPSRWRLSARTASANVR